MDTDLSFGQAKKQKENFTSSGLSCTKWTWVVMGEEKSWKSLFLEWFMKFDFDLKDQTLDHENENLPFGQSLDEIIVDVRSTGSQEKQTKHRLVLVV